MGNGFARRTIFAGLFVLAILVGDRLLAGVCELLTIRSHARFSRIFAGGASAELVVMGNSRGVHSFFAPKLGAAQSLSAVNLSYNGTSTEITEQLLDEYLRHNTPPKILVLEVTNLFQSPEHGLINLRPFVHRSPGLQSLYQRYRKTEYYGMQISHLYRYNCEWFLRSLFYLRHDDQKWIIRSTISQEALAEIRNSPKRRVCELPDFERNVAAFRRIVDRIRQAGIQLRLVIAPYLPEYRKQIVDWDEFINRVKNASGGERIWDYSNCLREERYFADGVHTNLDGALAFQQALEEDEAFFCASDRKNYLGRNPRTPRGANPNTEAK